MTSPITTHVLDTHLGKAAAHVPVSLWRQNDQEWTLLASGSTDEDGRNRSLLKPNDFINGVYQIRFDTKTYHDAQGVEGFYPEAVISFYVKDASQHYHVPLLISPFAYSTYRGT